MSFSHYAQASPSRTELYNGNIASMIVNVPNLGDAMAYAYKYDQLNRLTGMNAYNGLDLATNQYDLNRAGFANQMYDYQERVSYDANGNILTYFRNGTTRNGHVLGMDDLTYNYISGTNQLDHVNDKVPATNYSEDIDDQASGNYAYDQIGNLIMDNSENITDIEWTVYGKIKSITKGGGYKKKPTSFIQYRYDAAGNRICKISDIYGSLITTHTETYYVRDAQGNVMSIYEKQGTSDLYQTELNIYGSSRLGMEKVNVDVQTIVDNTTAMSGVVNNLGYSSNFVRGNKYYELSNHLGNVLATITDKKVGMSNTAGSMQVDYYVAEVSTATDYYPFGMAMPGRNGYAVSGGWANSTMKVNGQTFPADLSITSRANNTPAEYTAANSISFIGEYENGGTDEYMAYIIDPNNMPASSSPADNSSDANSNVTGSSDEGYRYGFNGKEKDGDINNSVDYDYGFRIYDPRLGRFLSVDPKASKFPELTPYQFASNCPISAIDLDGLEAVVVVTGQIGGFNDNSRGKYPMYNVEIYEKMTLSEYKELKQSGKLRPPDATFLLSRDAWRKPGRDDRSSNRYGSNNETPPGEYYLEYTKNGFGSKHYKLKISDEKGGDLIKGPDGNREGVRIHQYSPHDAEGCLTTGSGRDAKPVDDLINKIPSLKDNKEVRIILEPREATYDTKNELFRGSQSTTDSASSSTGGWHPPMVQPSNTNGSSSKNGSVPSFLRTYTN